MKPPVEAPISRQIRPAGSTPKRSMPWASFRPPRETQGWSRPRTASAPSSGTVAPGLSIRRSPWNTAPAMTSAWALLRESAMPRSTSNLVNAHPGDPGSRFSPCAILARIFRRGHGLRGAIGPAGQESRCGDIGPGLTHPAGPTAPPSGSGPDARQRGVRASTVVPATLFGPLQAERTSGPDRP